MFGFIKSLVRNYEHGRALRSGVTYRLNVTQQELVDIFVEQIGPLKLDYRGSPFIRVVQVGHFNSIVKTYGHVLVVPNTLII